MIYLELILKTNHLYNDMLIVSDLHLYKLTVVDQIISWFSFLLLQIAVRKNIYACTYFPIRVTEQCSINQQLLIFFFGFN